MYTVDLIRQYKRWFAWPHCLRVMTSWQQHSTETTSLAISFGVWHVNIQIQRHIYIYIYIYILLNLDYWCFELLQYQVVVHSYPFILTFAGHFYLLATWHVTVVLVPPIQSELKHQCTTFEFSRNSTGV